MSRKHTVKDKIRGYAVYVGRGMKSIPEDEIIRIGYWPGGRIKGGPGAVGESKKERFEDDRNKNRINVQKVHINPFGPCGYGYIDRQQPIYCGNWSRRYSWIRSMPDWPHILCRADTQTPLSKKVPRQRGIFKLSSTPEYHALRGHTAFGS